MPRVPDKCPHCAARIHFEEETGGTFALLHEKPVCEPFKGDIERVTKRPFVAETASVVQGKKD